MADMEIPHTQLSSEALGAVVEEFILREGTDYGAFEISLESKVQQVIALLDRGEAVIVFDAASETCSIVTKA
ncbi:MAG: YheU family protein [Gammaproteobacteria bacterium]|nr:YheU family protein [Gammaproteobacteria bacterium]